MWRATAISRAWRISSWAAQRRSDSSATVGWRPSEGDQVVAGVLDPHAQRLQPARRAERPRVIAEVLPKLTEDRRHREAAEPRAHVGIEAVDRVQEPDAGDLLEVLDRLSGVPVAMGEAAGERQVTPDALSRRRSS